MARAKRKGAPDPWGFPFDLGLAVGPPPASRLSKTPVGSQPKDEGTSSRPFRRRSEMLGRSGLEFDESVLEDMGI